MAAELETLKERKSAPKKDMDGPPAPPVRLHPNLAEVYRQKVENLREALNLEGMLAEAAAILRGLIEEIVLTPEDGELRVDLRGEIAGILNLCSESKKPAAAVRDGLEQVKLVAGARYQRESPALRAEI